MLDPEEKPREFLTMLLAAGLMVFKTPSPTPENALDTAAEFVAAAEKRFGPLNP